jgi:hypothetical protein
MPKDNALLPPTIHLGYLPDKAVINYLARARDSIRFLRPGLSTPAARVLAERWQQLGSSAVEAVLDDGADLCRMGYCDGPALRLLLDTAKRLQATIHRQTGVRLCVLEIDGEQIIFTPPRFQREPDFGVTSVNYDFAELLARAGEPS